MGQGQGCMADAGEPSEACSEGGSLSFLQCGVWHCPLKEKRHLVMNFLGVFLCIKPIFYAVAGKSSQH